MDKISYIAELEAKIKEKYGNQALKHPQENWDEEKEMVFQENYKRNNKNYKTPLKMTELINKKRKLRANRSCKRCKVLSFSVKDDVYMNKYNCCFKCYIKHIEGKNNEQNQASIKNRNLRHFE